MLADVCTLNEKEAMMLTAITMQPSHPVPSTIFNDSGAMVLASMSSMNCIKWIKEMAGTLYCQRVS